MWWECAAGIVNRGKINLSYVRIPLTPEIRYQSDSESDLVAWKEQKQETFIFVAMPGDLRFYSNKIWIYVKRFKKVH